MNARTTCKLLSLVALPVALFGCASSPRSADTALPEPDREALPAAIAAFDAGWNEHDPDALAALLTDDAVTVTPRGTRVEGRAAHHDMYAAPGPTKQTQSTSTIDGVQWLADDLVLVDAQQTLDGPGTEALGANQARAVIVLRWDGEAWKTVAARPFVPHDP